MIPSVAVCLAVHNGRTWLEEQLKTIFSQFGVNVVVFLSVDLSCDGSEALADRIAESESRVRVLPHGCRFGGAAKNFFRILNEVNFAKFDYVSFADQDDIWLPHKLLRAHEVLSATNADAYSSDVIAFWPNGRRAVIRKSQRQVQWDFLFEAAGPGCTYVLKSDMVRSMQELMGRRWDDIQKVGLHDWFTYAFARANAFKWVIDDYPGMLYRQHEANQVGVNVGLRASLFRARRVLSGWGISQALLIADLVGVACDPFVMRFSGNGKIGSLWLMINSGRCRRRIRDKVMFAASCFVLLLLRSGR